MPKRLLTGWLLAIALHWVALDYWRGQGMYAQEDSPVAPQMQVSITEVQQQEKARAEALPRAAELVSPTAAVKQKTALPDAIPPIEVPTEHIAAPGLPETETGFRSMNFSEELVFYRIELARRLDPRLFVETTPAKLVITLNAEGVVGAWRFDDGRAVPGGWVSAIRAAAVPDALRGRMHEIVLEIKP